MTLCTQLVTRLIVCHIFFSRRAKLHPQKQRSKYICKPEAVVEAGNHFVWEFIPGRGSLNVPADAGILHHYRVICIYTFNQFTFLTSLSISSDDCSLSFVGM